MSIHFISR